MHLRVPGLWDGGGGMKLVVAERARSRGATEIPLASRASSVLTLRNRGHNLMKIGETYLGRLFPVPEALPSFDSRAEVLWMVVVSKGHLRQKYLPCSFVALTEWRHIIFLITFFRFFLPPALLRVSGRFCTLASARDRFGGRFVK